MRLLALVALVALAACGSHAPISAPPPARTPVALAPKPSGVTRERAEAALRDDAPLDYARPLEAKSYDRSATAQLFHGRCEGGDKRACIIEAQLAPQTDLRNAYRVVEANCRAGDLMSCRALPLDEGAARFPDVRGAMSRRTECHKPKLPAPCDVEAVRRECADGFTVACGELQTIDPPPPDIDELDRRWPELSLAGCMAGIATECVNVTQYGSDAQMLDNAQRLCNLDRSWCGALAQVYARGGDHPREHEALERECEYGKDRWGTCARLGEAYLDGTLAEPVPGRGQALIDWACPKLATWAATNKLDLLRFHPACKRASKSG